MYDFIASFSFNACAGAGTVDRSGEAFLCCIDCTIKEGAVGDLKMSRNPKDFGASNTMPCALITDTL